MDLSFLACVRFNPCMVVSNTAKEAGDFTLVVDILLQNKGNIRIHHECESGIEKSAPRITVWHHKAYRVMINGDQERQIFLSHPHTNNIKIMSVRVG